jgi:hypothetical protein
VRTEVVRSDVVRHGEHVRAGLVRHERATAAMLAPAMALVLVVLAAIALDLSAVAGTQRAAERVVAAAADDAAGMLDGRAHQHDGSVRVDREAAVRIVKAHLDAADLPGRLRDLDVLVTDTTVDVTVRVESPHLFLRAVPGMDDVALSAPIRVRARLRTDPG